MRASFAKILGASAVLVLGSACGGSAKKDGGAAGDGAGGFSFAGASGAVAANGGADTAGAGGSVSAGASGANTSGGMLNTAGGPPVDIGPQTQASKLDVLFVVDNSVSMGDKQGVLGASVSGFVTQLTKSVKDIHFGVITTSIGGHGGTICPAATAHADDQAELLPAKRTGVPSYNASSFLSFDAAGKTGVADAAAVAADLQQTITAAGQDGCGYEAPLEAMYRFLIDPEPPTSIKMVQSTSTPDGINADLLKQRQAFLRPDSAVAIVILSDENDCSIRDDGLGWFVTSTTRMPKATSACDANPNDPCCRSCATYEASPPAGCSALSADSVCKNVSPGGAYATLDAMHDSLNLRCFNQVGRFGFDLLYPVERYSNGLSNPKVTNRAGMLVDNPLLAGGRSATLISVATIVGAPWQDLATPASLTAGHALEYLGGAGLTKADQWSLLLRDSAKNKPPTDPFMIESIEARTGENPLTHDKISAASSPDPKANAINGHEQNVFELNDLQYACTYPLPSPHVCASRDASCNCSPNDTDASAVIQANSPACQPPAGGPAGTTQYYAKAYPGSREIQLAQLLGERSVPASICPKVFDDAASADYAYKPALSALAARIATTLK